MNWRWKIEWADMQLVWGLALIRSSMDERALAALPPQFELLATEALIGGLDVRVIDHVGTNSFRLGVGTVFPSGISPNSFGKIKF